MYNTTNRKEKQQQRIPNYHKINYYKPPSITATIHKQSTIASNFTLFSVHITSNITRTQSNKKHSLSSNIIIIKSVQINIIICFPAQIIANEMPFFVMPFSKFPFPQLHFHQSFFVTQCIKSFKKDQYNQIKSNQIAWYNIVSHASLFQVYSNCTLY